MTNEADVESIRIESIAFTNYKALRKATLPLSPFTLLLGPNGSGKSSVLHALRAVAKLSINRQDNNLKDANIAWQTCRSIANLNNDDPIHLKLSMRHNDRSIYAIFIVDKSNTGRPVTVHIDSANEYKHRAKILDWLSNMQSYALDAKLIAGPIQVRSAPLTPTGAGLVAVLDDIKDNHPENWNSFIRELKLWLPEYDNLLFDKPTEGQKSIVLRTKLHQARIPAQELSQGTLIALALLTLAYMPNPPSVVGLEEIDRGLHPRLLRHLRDALYRLSYPQSAGIDRPPIQVIATTHSPYMLDLFRDHPEEVVLAEKKGLEVEFKRLSEMDHYTEILGDSPLSEVWYSGVLGGVTVKP